MGGARSGDRQRLGLRGERAAERELRRAGLRILERRFRVRWGEIDLIAEDGELLVFVEVKTRSGAGFGEPARAVTAAKQRRLERVALGYLQRRGALARPCRFDVVEVRTDGDEGDRVRYIPDAFRLWPRG